MQYYDGQYIFPVDLQNIFKALKHKGVLTGLFVSPSGLGVTISSGQYIGDGIIYFSGTILQENAPSSYPRRDLVVVNYQGNATIIYGVEAPPSDVVTNFVLLSSPQPPTLPDDCIALAELYVRPGATSLKTDDIYDRRIVFSPPYIPLYSMDYWEGDNVTRFQKISTSNLSGHYVLYPCTLENVSATISGTLKRFDGCLTTKFYNSSIEVNGSGIDIARCLFENSYIVFRNCSSINLHECKLLNSTIVLDNVLNAKVYTNYLLDNSAVRLENFGSVCLIFANISTSTIFVEFTEGTFGLINIHSNICQGTSKLTGSLVAFNNNFIWNSPNKGVEIFGNSFNIKIAGNIMDHCNYGIVGTVPIDSQITIEHNAIKTSLSPLNLTSNGFAAVQENFFATTPTYTGKVWFLDNYVGKMLSGTGQRINFAVWNKSIPAGVNTINWLVLPSCFLFSIGRFLQYASSCTISLVLGSQTLDTFSSLGLDLTQQFANTISASTLYLISSSPSSNTITGGYVIGIC